MIKALLKSSNLYISFWLLVNVNPFVAIVPDSVSVACLFLLFAWSLYYLYKVITTCPSNPYINGLNCIFLIVTIYGLYRFFEGEVYYRWLSGDNTPIGPREFIIEYWKSLLPIYAFYYYSFIGQLTKKSLMTWSVIFLAAITVSYYGEESKRIAELLMETDQDGVTNNTGYRFLAILPLLAFFNRKPLLQYGFLAYAIMYIIMGMKRGAIIIGGLCLMIFVWETIRNASIFKKVLLLFFASCLFYIGYKFILWNIENNAYFLARIDDTLSGNTSGRDTIFVKLINFYFYETNLTQILFGIGADGTFLAIGQAAHNDWLEILIDMGLLGLCCYIYYWIQFFRTWKISKSSNDDIRLCLTILLVTFFLKTIFSMSVNSMSIYATCALGFALANLQTNMKNRNICQN